MAGESPLFVTMEMSAEQITDRLLAIDAEIELEQMQTGRFTSHSVDRIVSVIQGYEKPS